MAVLPFAGVAVAGVVLAGCGGKAKRESPKPAASAAVPAPISTVRMLAIPAASSAAWDVGQWTIYGQNAMAVTPGVAYGLLNNYNQKSLKYQSRDYGINLSWDDSRTGRYVVFRRPGTSTAPLTYGEPLALQILGGGSYVRYKVRTYGINLDWSPTPVYEWEIDGGPFGTQVRGDSDFSTVQSTGRSSFRVRLFNRTHGDYVLYGSRDFGINLKWYADEIKGDSYPAVPFPGDLRSPSGEPGQALLSGIAYKTEVFHGGTDDELDWHIFIHLDPAVQSALVTHMVAHAKRGNCAHIVSSICQPLRLEDLNEFWSEWMVMDGYNNSTFDERFYSADVGPILGLQSKSAWAYSDEAGNSQNVTGATAVPSDSKLVNAGARVYMQGPFVNDSAHGFRLELHPMDSVAYAMDSSGNPLSFGSTDPRWPAKSVTWRVAAFTNATIHRVDNAEYVKKDRTTTWWLPLPASPTGTTRRPPVERAVQWRVQETAPGFDNYAVSHNVGGLDKHRNTGSRYTDYGLASKSFAIEKDPADGRTKLRVTVTMTAPDFFGGMFLRDYTISEAPPVATQ